MREWLRTLQARWYAFRHPEHIDLTIVRRYTDAKRNFIGELYLGKSMIGMSCDSLPFSVGDMNGAPLPIRPWLEFRRDFTDPMFPNTIRVGALEPHDNEHVRQTIALRRFCTIRVAIINRFIEAALEEHVRDSQRS